MLLLATVAAAIGVLVQQWQSAPNSAPATNTAELNKAILLPSPKALPQVQFTSHRGEAFATSDFVGHWQVLFFGFTHCPDICPTTLHTLKQVKDALTAQDQWRAKVTMITVDPQRDSPERLAQYVPYFDADFMGLTSDLDSLTAFAKNLGVLFVAREPDENGNYDVDHTAALILLNPQGQYAGVITAPHLVSDLVHDLEAITRNAPPISEVAPKITSTDNSVAATKQSSDDGSQGATALQISDAWIRPAPPTASALAAYMTLSNVSQAEIAIVSASSPMFDEIMIHATRLEDGMANMNHLESLNIAAMSSLELAPMGHHLMLMDPVKTIAENDLIPITLELENGVQVQHMFSVKHPETSP